MGIMGPASLADLEALAASGNLEPWLARIPDEAARSRLRRALAIDRRLCTLYPQSLASCLLARTRGDHALEGLHAGWRRELEERGAPWVEALRPLPVSAGLLAELHSGDGIAMAPAYHVAFETDDVVTLRYLAPHDQLRWSWRHSKTPIERCAEPSEPAPGAGFPRFESHGWGETFLVRSPDAAPIALPCPDGGSASARLSSDGTRVIVYGTYDDYDGGFVYLVDPTTLAIERSVDTARPVSKVHECTSREVWLVETYGGLVAWIDGQARALPIPQDLARAAALSPSGTHVATLGDGLRVWSLDELLARGDRPSKPGFPARFDPTGERLLAGTTMFDGMTGQKLAELKPGFGQYLEGGPARPWMKLGTRHLISLHGGLRLWDTRSAARVSVTDRPSYASWYGVAYDRAGLQLAALRRGDDTVRVHELPGGPVRTMTFGLCGVAIAMSPDGHAVAVQQGGAIEVRTADGALRFQGGQVATGDADERGGSGLEDTLRFSVDGARIARFVEGDGWRIWSLDGAQEVEHVIEREAIAEVADFAPPRPHDWTIEPDTMTVFVHRPTGARIAIPVAGPWICNPADPQIVASDGAHLRLRARP
jgi:hypothetical protein